MPLPEFRPDGWLPEGHHPANWEEIVLRFGQGEGSGRAYHLEGQFYFTKDRTRRF